jgi:predicted aconitase/predicted aconitase with swiveling domain
MVVPVLGTGQAMTDQNPAVRPDLSDGDIAMLDGERGEGPRIAMELVLGATRALGAERLLDISGAHVDGCLYHGQAGLDFALRLVEAGARVAVPTTLNVSSLDLLHPERFRGDPDFAEQGRRLMDAYVDLGCRPTWTCAPYQLMERPSFGDQVAWAESNAIVFANSVLGARTGRYGDFIDICAAVTGRAPAAGLHLDTGRRARLVVRLESVPDEWLDDDAFYPVLGHVLGRLAGSRVPVVVGLPSDTGEDRLKAVGAAAASVGSVAMFHAVGVTPEAATLGDALGGLDPEHEVLVGPDMLSAAAAELSTVDGMRPDAVCVGTPHASMAELGELARLLDGRRVRVETFVHTGRGDLAAATSDVGALEAAGVRMVTDTCTYITPILDPAARVVMTDSAKWAWYAPANLGVEVVFGSRRDCIDSAVSGEVTRHSALWRGDGPVRWDELALPEPSGDETTYAVLCPGSAAGPALPLRQPLSFWGGVDPADGRIIDPHHPQHGESVTGRVILMPSGRGSSSSSSVLAESLRLGTGPAAIVLSEPDVIIAVGAMVASELYGAVCPVVVAPREGTPPSSGAPVEVMAGEGGVNLVW